MAAAKASAGKAAPPTGTGGGKLATAKAASTRAKVAAPSPSWLAPMTPQQVTKTATSLVTSAYAPAQSAVQGEANTENGILAKQQSDNQFYQQWLDAKTGQLQAHQDTVDASTNALEQQLTGNQLSTFAAEPGQETAAANARSGNVNNNAASFTAGQSALGNYQAGMNQAQETQLGGQALNTLNTVPLADANLASAALNTGNAIQAGAAKQNANYTTAMSKIAAAGVTLDTKEGAALQSEITKLNTTNITLSENNRNYATAAAKLGISAATAKSEINARAATQKINQAKLANTIAEDAFNNQVKQENANTAQGRLNLDYKKYVLSIANTNSEIAARNATAYAKTHGVLTPSEQNTQFNIIDKATGEINGLIQHGMKPNVAYQAVLNGYYTLGTKTVHVPRMSNQSMLNAAYNLRAGNAGLTQGDVNYLQNVLHLTNVSQRYGGRVVAPAGANAASQAVGAAGAGLGGA